MPFPSSARSPRSPRTASRRSILTGTALAAALGTGACSRPSGTDAASDGGGSADRAIEDVLGRKVTIPSSPQRILLGGQRELYTTAFLQPDDPLDKIVGWPDDLVQNDPDTYEKYRAKFPDVASMKQTGEIWDGSFSTEQALQLRPDVLVISASSFDAAEEAGIIGDFEKAEVPTVVIDYFVEPVAHTIPSVRLMGTIFGRQDRAEAFIDHYDAKVSHVSDTLAKAGVDPTSTFLWRAPGYFDCCSTFKDSNLSKIVEFAGGRNIGDALLKTEQGDLSPEAVAAEDPDVILATGADWAPGKTPVKEGGFVPLGYDEDPDEAASTWQEVVDQQSVIREMRAVGERRAFVAWHHFYDSPYNFLAVEWFARALHPDLFDDLDPEADFRELHEKFLPVDASGTFWTGLPA